MDNSITVGGLLGVLLLLVASGLMGFAMLSFFASGMSTNGEASAEAERSGCRTGIIGIVLMVVGCVLLFGR